MNPLSLNQILDNTIVFFAVFAALSTICSSIQEWIAERPAIRGWALIRAVPQLVGGDRLIAADLSQHSRCSTTLDVAGPS